MGYESIMQNKANLRRAKMDVNFYSTKDYENERLSRCGENKANSKPIYILPQRTLSTQRRRIIGVSGCSIDKYVLYHISPRSGLGHPVDLRTRRLMKNKANFKGEKMLLGLTSIGRDLQKSYWLFLAGSKIFTMFLPACLAVYNAWSDRLVISSGLVSASY